MASDSIKTGKSHKLFQFGFTSKTNESEYNIMEPRVKKPKIVDPSPSVKAKLRNGKALTYVQTETNIEIGSLLRCDYQRIHNELLLHISTHYEQVFSGLAMLAWKDESYDGTKPITKPEDIVMATVEI
ncbi:serine/threonine-protein kinase atr-like [Tachypleus tridentatus]|uniref:serine/threonine-protein kinase atr-like n=1 Tax=Tachypleus tridentatus TaxID=6853 RepID=UPI003FD30FB1